MSNISVDIPIEIRWAKCGQKSLSTETMQDDLVKNRISSATSSLRILLEYVYKGLVIVHCANEEDLKPQRIEKLWKRQERKGEKDASLDRLAKELRNVVPHLDVLRHLLK